MPSWNPGCPVTDPQDAGGTEGWAVDVAIGSRYGCHVSSTTAEAKIRALNHDWKKAEVWGWRLERYTLFIAGIYNCLYNYIDLYGYKLYTFIYSIL